MLILIGGPTASGKSTFARELANRCGASVVKMDDFYHTAGEQEALKLGENWDHPKMLDWKLFYKTMRDVLTGKTVKMPVFDKRDASRSFREFEPRDVVVLEGIWALNERCRLKGDLRIYLDARPEIRLQRRIERGVREEGRTPEFTRHMWENYVVPMEKIHVFPGKATADVVVTEENFQDALGKVLQLIKLRSEARQV